MNVKINSITIGGDATYGDLVKVYNGSNLDTNPPLIPIGTTHTLDIIPLAADLPSAGWYTFKLTEPANKTIYDAIKGKPIAIQLEFNVVPGAPEPGPPPPP